MRWKYLDPYIILYIFFLHIIYYIILYIIYIYIYVCVFLEYLLKCTKSIVLKIKPKIADTGSYWLDILILENTNGYEKTIFIHLVYLTRRPFKCYHIVLLVHLIHSPRSRELIEVINTHFISFLGAH